jgi:hypothetical protein
MGIGGGGAHQSENPIMAWAVQPAGRSTAAVGSPAAEASRPPCASRSSSTGDAGRTQSTPPTLRTTSCAYEEPAAGPHPPEKAVRLEGSQSCG